jgi:hypothetical protein
MKIYFGFTVAGDRSSIDTARKVVHLLQETGHQVLTRHLVDDNAWEADRSISPQDVYRREVAAKVSLLITGNIQANCTLVPYAAVEEVEEFVARNIGK